MRRIAIINQKGGVGKTTTTANLGAALAIQGRRVVVVDMDAQANLSLALGVEAKAGSPTSYSVLIGDERVGACLLATKVPNLRLVASNIDLSGAELELAAAMGREFLLRDALREWDEEHRKEHGRAAADYVLFDCPPSLGLLSINALAAAGEVLITLQTEFLALQGMSKLIDIVQLLKKRLNPDLVVAGIVPTLYDSRLKLAREVLGEIRRYFKDEVVPHPVRHNVKLAEAPSFAQTIFEYAPDSKGASDYMNLARELVARESRDPDLAGLPPFDETARLPLAPTAGPVARRAPPPPPRKKVEPDPVTKPQPTTATIAKLPAPKTSGAKVSETQVPAATVPVAEPRVTKTPVAKPTVAKVPTKKLVPAPPPEKVAETKPAVSHESPRSKPSNDRHPTTAANPPSAAAHHAKVKPHKPVPRASRPDPVPHLPPDAFEILSTPIDP
jgi:chromosome partitioning protein